MAVPLVRAGDGNRHFQYARGTALLYADRRKPTNGGKKMWVAPSNLYPQLDDFSVHDPGTFRGVAYVWVKTNARGKIIAGQGVPPTFTKPTTELLLVATTIPAGRPFPILDLAQPQVVLNPRSAHSEKPPVFRELIESLCGKRPRIELFARKRSPGWDAWGAEL